jgi:lysophospholipase L1-like esterase
LLTVALVGGGAFAVPAFVSPVHASAAAVLPYYLSLGDSLSQGVQPNKLGVDVKTKAGYANGLYEDERVSIPGLQLKKLGCPGETTTSMISGGICTYPEGNQLAQAVQFISTHDVALITIDIGANDIDNCVSGLTVNEACIEAAISDTTPLGTIPTNLPVLIGTLEAAAPGVPIYAMNYYDPFLAAWLAGTGGQTLAETSLTLAGDFNGELGAIYGAFSVPVADVATAFDTNDIGTIDPNTGLPNDVSVICRDTWMCGPPNLPQYDNIHANVNGYAVITDTFATLIGNL